MRTSDGSGRIADRQPMRHATSLHFDFLPQIGRHVEVLAFDDCRFAFFKATTRDRLELQHFLFRLHGFFGDGFSSLAGRRLSSAARSRAVQACRQRRTRSD